VTRFLLALATLFALAMATGPASAVQRFGIFSVYPDRPEMIQLVGQINEGSLNDFRRALAAAPRAEVLLLQSPGGRVDVGLQLASEIRRRHLSTAIPAGYFCYSACTYLFFAGVEHVVRGKLGVHQVYDSANPGVPGYDGDIRAALTRYGAPAAVLKAMASTPASTIHIFSSREIAAYALNKGAANSLAAFYAAH
jgi:hypothetical protein